MKLFTETELISLYNNKVNLPDSYFKKYEYLPLCPLKCWGYAWKNNDFPRVWCILDFQEWIYKYKLYSPDVVGYTCASDPELEFVQAKENILVEYPKYDLHTIGNDFTNRFDLFIFNQTLEHLYNPYIAIENIYKTVKPGGYVFTSVPTLNIPHMTPIHFGGFTPMGLATMFVSGGFEIIEIGQWGCYDYIRQLWSNHQWPGYVSLHRNNYVPNERDNCCQCWILARKPE